MKTLAKSIADLNDLNMVRYLKILGFDPLVANDDKTLFELYINKPGRVILTIDHATNQFNDKANNQQGGLVDLACLIFHISPAELCNNIVPYGIDRLMQEHTRQKGNYP